MAHTATNAHKRTHTHARVDRMNVVERSGVSDLVHIGVTEALVGPAAVGLQDHLRRCNRATIIITTQMGNARESSHAAAQPSDNAAMQQCSDAQLQTYGPHALGSAACSGSGARRLRTSEYPVVSTQSTLCEYSEYQL